MKGLKFRAAISLIILPLVGCGGGSGGGDNGTDDNGDKNKPNDPSGPGVEFTLPTIEHAHILVKQSDIFTRQAVANEAEIYVSQQPKQGSAQVNLIGGENWEFNYTSTACYEGADQYYYTQNGEFGKANVVIASPIVNKTLIVAQNTGRGIELDEKVTQGTVTLTQPANGVSSYDANTRILSYLPDFGFVGKDLFTYSFNGCAKNVAIEVTPPPQILSAKDSAHGQELWITSGTAAQTTLLKDIRVGSDSSWPSNITAKGDGKYFFVANDGIHKSELWITDATENGTQMVKDIHPDASVTKPDNLTMLNGTLYFLADSDNDYDRELWKSDGTADGTILVKDLGASAGYMSAHGNYLIFGRQDNAGGADREPWISDGTTAGTKRLKDINSGNSGSQFGEQFVFFNNKLYSSANDGNNGSELWVTDFTEAGTMMVKDINPGDYSSNSSPEGFTVYGNHIYFKAYQTTTGWALWRSNGSIGHAEMVKDIDATASDWGSKSIGDLTVYNNKLYFAGINNGTKALWTSDGTENGTVEVKQVEASNYFDGNFLSVVDTYLLFVAGLNDNELWRTDGSEQGTVKIKTLSPFINGMTWSVDDVLPFISVGNNGEVWTTDGTESGTVKLK